MTEAQEICIKLPECGGVTKLKSGKSQLRVGNDFKPSTVIEKSWRKIPAKQQKETVTLTSTTVPKIEQNLSDWAFDLLT